MYEDGVKATAKNKIDYINTHGTSTPVGDITELKAVGEVFDDYKPKISSTKSLAGHSLGATSVHEAVYSLIMMKNNFIAASANINEMDEEAKKYPIVTKVEKNVNLNSMMSNSFGFGGTNATLIFQKGKIMSLMKGKKGLIMGVANERSIAWGISQKLADAGAELAFTYLGDALKEKSYTISRKTKFKYYLQLRCRKKRGSC